MNFQEFKEHSVKSGLGVVLTYKLPSEKKYHIVCPLTSIPSVAGSRNTIEYSTTSNSAITHIPAKATTNDVEVTFPFNADTVAIMDLISDQDLSYAIIDLETGLGWKFVANGTYRLNDVDADSVLEGTLQLTVSSVEDKVSEDMLSLYMDTITFESSIPSRIDLGASDTQTINVITNPSTATLSANATSSNLSASVTGGVLTITSTGAGTGYVVLKATASDYAENQRKIYVVAK